MLVGTQAVLQASDQRHTEQVTAARTTAEHVVTGTVLPEDTAARLARLPGVEAATGTLPTEVFLLDGGLSGWDTPWEAAGVDLAGAPRTLDPLVLRGDVRDVRGHAVAISAVVAEEGGVDVGDVLHARMADTRAATLRVAAVYERAAGLGHVLLDPVVARRHAASRTDSAVFVAGGPDAARSLARYAAAHPGVEAMDRREYLDTVEVALRNDGTWGVWLVIGMALAFTALALVNTAAMATAERRGELATIRLLGGTPGQAMRMIALELVPIVAVALAAGGAIAGRRADGRAGRRARHPARGAGRGHRGAAWPARRCSPWRPAPSRRGSRCASRPPRRCAHASERNSPVSSSRSTSSSMSCSEVSGSARLNCHVRNRLSLRISRT